MPQPRAMFQKVSDSHTVVKDPSSGEVLLYVDRLMLTDTSSFHAFDALRSENRPVRRARSSAVPIISRAARAIVSRT